MICRECGQVITDFNEPCPKRQAVSEVASNDGLCKKPPLGLKPHKMHSQERALDIIAAMERYVEADKPIPEEWFEELHDMYGVA